MLSGPAWLQVNRKPFQTGSKPGSLRTATLRAARKMREASLASRSTGRRKTSTRILEVHVRKISSVASRNGLQSRGKLKRTDRKNAARYCFSVVDHSAKVNVLFRERLARVRRVGRSRNGEQMGKATILFRESFTQFCCLTINIGICADFAC
jgi:hypothetical protein